MADTFIEFVDALRNTKPSGGFFSGVTDFVSGALAAVGDFIQGASPEAQNKREMIEVFNDADIDINFRDEQGRNALHWAVVEGDPELVRFLITKNIDLNVQDRTGRTAFHYLVDNLDKKTEDLMTVERMTHEFEILDILKNSGANMSVIDEKGQTILHRLVQNRKFVALEQVLKPHSDGAFNWNANRAAKIQDANGNTPLHYAAQEGNILITKALLPHSDVTLTNNEGKQPLDLVHPVYKNQFTSLLTEKAKVTHSGKVASPVKVGAGDFSTIATPMSTAVIEKPQPTWIDRMKEFLLSIAQWFKGEEQKDKYAVPALDVTPTDKSISVLTSDKKVSGGIGSPVSLRQHPPPILKGSQTESSAKGAAAEDMEPDFKPREESPRGSA